MFDRAGAGCLLEPGSVVATGTVCVVFLSFLFSFLFFSSIFFSFLSSLLFFFVFSFLFLLFSSVLFLRNQFIQGRKFGPP